jgi:DNA-directed RNA polymerase subunit RPC12/RpoP
MTNSTIPVSFRCKDCGTLVTWPENAIDSTPISCTNCGLHLGTYGDIGNAAAEAVGDKIETLFKDAIDRR